MMKRLKICCFLGLALLLLTLPVRGAELPPEVEQALPREAGQLLKDVDHWDVNSFPEGLCAIWNHLRKDVNTVLRRQTRGAVSVLLVAVLCGLVSGFQKGVGDESRFLPMAGGLAVTALTAGSLDSLMGAGTAVMEQMNTFSKALLPTLSAAVAASGGIVSASVRQVATIFFVDLLLSLIRGLLLPLVYFYVAAAAADAMLPGRRLAGISRAIRKGTVWLLTGALALFTLYLTVSGAAAGSADTVTARLARSAVGVLPVVGSILADAADSVLAGAGAVKNTVGAAGLLAVLAVCLLPLVRLGVQYLVYKAAAFLAGILGAEQLTGLIDALGGAFGLIFGMTGACGLLLLISISSALGVVTG